MPRRKKAPTPPPGPPFHGNTPRSVLEAPKLVPERIWPPREPKWYESPNFAGPYRTSKIRKIRRGRMARFNH
jgi:hypothetical protein